MPSRRRVVTVAGASTGPLGISGCLAWYRGSSLAVSDGAAISQWDDESGNARHLLQAAGSKQPLYRATGGPNSRPCIEFDGTDDFLRVTWAQSQPEHLFVVGQFLRVGAGSDTMVDGSASNSLRVGSFDATRVFAQTSAVLLLTATPTNWQRYEVQYNGASGSFLANAGTPVTGNIGATAAGGLCLGILGDQTTSPAYCKIAEVIMYSAILDAAQLARIRSYLEAKYA